MGAKLTPYHVIAKVVRVETEPKSDSIFLVFEVVDEVFKQKIKQDWMQDIEVKLIGKDLVKL